MLIKIHKNNAEYILLKKLEKLTCLNTHHYFFYGNKSPMGETILKYSFRTLFITWTEQSEKLTAQQQEIWSLKKSNPLSRTSPQPGSCETFVPSNPVIAVCNKSVPPLYVSVHTINAIENISIVDKSWCKNNHINNSDTAVMKALMECRGD